MGQWLVLPISAGIGLTKTFAKLANRCAKKRDGWGGVCDLTTLPDAALIELMADIKVQEVWGIGRNIAMQLMEHGIRTVTELRACDARRVRERWGVVMERTVRELQGIACIEMEDEPPAKKQIISSRSFGDPLHMLDQQAEPVRFYIARAAEKLRQQDGTAGRIGVFLETNRFRQQDAQYSPSKSIALHMATGAPRR